MTCNCKSNCICSDTEIKQIVQDAVADQAQSFQDLTAKSEASQTAAAASEQNAANSATRAKGFSDTSSDNATAAASSAQHSAQSAAASADSAKTAYDTVESLRTTSDSLSKTSIDLANSASEINKNIDQVHSDALTASDAAKQVNSDKLSVSQDKADVVSLSSSVHTAAQDVMDAKNSVDASELSASVSAASAKDSATSASLSLTKSIGLAETYQNGIVPYISSASIQASKPTSLQIAMDTSNSNNLWYWNGNTWTDLGISLDTWLKNEGNLDLILNSSALTWQDSKGNTKKTWAGLLADIAGSGALGFPNEQALLAFVPSTSNALAMDTSTGIFYSWDGTTWHKSSKTDSGLIQSTGLPTGMLLAFVDQDSNVAMYLNSKGELITSGGLNGTTSVTTTSNVVWGIADSLGNIAIYVDTDGVFHTDSINVGSTRVKTYSDNPFGIADSQGNLGLILTSEGKLKVDLDPSVSTSLTTHTVNLATADTIMHVGDSLTESIWVVKDKAWMSLLGNFSPYRHVNYGVAGNTVLQMQTRVLNGTSVYGSNLQQIKPRFGFLSSFGNDYFMMDTDMKYYQESVQRAVDVMNPYCEQVVLVTEFCATQNIRTVYEEVARQNNLPYIHTDTLAYQLGKIPLGDQSLFHQGHIGTRNQGIWWYQILDWIKQQPIRKGIKIYRARTTPNAIGDLVFKNDYDRYTKFKELTVGHTYLTGTKDYDEIGDSTVSASMPQAKAADEYLTLQNGGTLANTYSLVEVYLDQNPKDIQSLIINVASSAATIYALSSTDASVNVSASSLTDAFKASYANPRSVWKLISQGQVIANSQLPSLFTGRKLSLLVVGGTLVNPQVTYKSKDRPFRQEIYPYVKPETLGSELASARIVGDSGWTLSSNIKTLKPIDNKFMVRAPDSTTQLTDVFTLPVGESLAQNISFTAKEDPRKFRVQAFARYFPKGYLDLTKSIYSGLDANQTLDSTVSTNNAPVTADSLDIYRLFAEIEVSDGGYNRPGGATDYSDIVGLTWKPVTFYVNAAPYANQLKIKLTTPDGELQIARFSVKEVI